MLNDSIPRENGDSTTGIHSKVTEASGALMDQENTSGAAAKTQIKDIYLTSPSNNNGSKHILSGGTNIDSDTEPNATPLTHSQTPFPKSPEETNPLNPSDPTEVLACASETSAEEEKQLSETSTDQGSSTSDRRDTSVQEEPSALENKETSAEEEQTSTEEEPATSDKPEVLGAQSFHPPGHQGILETQSPETTPEPAGQTTSDLATDTPTEIKVHLERELSGPTLLDETVLLMDTTSQIVIAAGQRNKEVDPMKNFSSEESVSKPRGSAMEELKEEEEEEDAMEEQEQEAGQNSLQGNGEDDDKKNDGHQKAKYKTVSYRRIRKGNTRQRIDEFESMINS
ncbi:ermin-like [Myripristis murdjan]|uniref:ermin-like n=1 Tax=Myripristis murdjan TaxID=586833 RepID=UPI00117648AC|nr:ermin-like [Myripristis murdjan]